jgi:hypothetical protein
LRNFNYIDLVHLSTGCIEGLKEFNWKSRKSSAEKAAELQATLEKVMRVDHLAL